LRRTASYTEVYGVRRVYCGGEATNSQGPATPLFHHPAACPFCDITSLRFFWTTWSMISPQFTHRHAWKTSTAARNRSKTIEPPQRSHFMY